MPTVLGRVLRFPLRNRVEIDNQYGAMTAKAAWGDTLPLVDTGDGFSAAIRILGTVSPQENGCWLWPEHDGNYVYPMIRFGNRKIGAHVASYRTFRGAVAAGLMVCHTCDTPRCCNPAHLFVGTGKDNSQDRDRKGRGGGPKIRGEQNPRRKLTEDDVREARRLYAAGGVTYKQLGERFGVHRFVITVAIKGQTWKHVV